MAGTNRIALTISAIPAFGVKYEEPNPAKLNKVMITKYIFHMIERSSVGVSVPSPAVAGAYVSLLTIFLTHCLQLLSYLKVHLPHSLSERELV